MKQTKQKQNKKRIEINGSGNGLSIRIDGDSDWWSARVYDQCELIVVHNGHIEMAYEDKSSTLFLSLHLKSSFNDKRTNIVSELQSRAQTRRIQE